MPLNAGDLAPEFILNTEGGKPFDLSSLRGKNVVLFFYPKADTPGCTTEVCSFRDALPEYPADAVVIGISPDAEKSQLKFRHKHELPFSLLADFDHSAADAYEVWIEKSMYDKTYFGVERTTFVIGKDGRIAHIFRKVKPDGHAREVLAALARLG